MNYKNLIRFIGCIEYFECPICQRSMKLQENSLICQSGHCFDISKYGYVNFILKSKKQINYNKQSFENRHFILENGMYNLILEKMVKFILGTSSITNILDIGCGEGFYSRHIQLSTNKNVFAFDLSKDSIQIASKNDKDGLIKWFVADLSSIPLKNSSMDCILDIFSPANYKEFQRILVPHGYIIKVIPTKNHLKEIREMIRGYLKKPDYSNKPVIEYFEKNLKCISREIVSSKFQLMPEQRKAFIEMTPLLFYVEKEKINWDDLTYLTIEAEILIGTF